MASASNDKDKTPLEDDHQDPQLKEEVESEAEEEEIEKDRSSRPSAVIASIGVVTNHDQFKKSAQIRTGGDVPHHSLAPRTSSSGNNPFYTLIHGYQFQRMPKAKLSSSWDIDRSNHAGKESSKSKEGWRNNSKSWDSQSDIFMSRIEHNSEMIRNLTYKIDELKALILPLQRRPSPPDRRQAPPEFAAQPAGRSRQPPADDARAHPGPSLRPPTALVLKMGLPAGNPFLGGGGSFRVRTRCQCYLPYNSYRQRMNTEQQQYIILAASITSKTSNKSQVHQRY
jgi:hypothetical protein